MGMTVLSLFDGISCGQLALIKAGVACDTYMASEIDKKSIKVTQRNFPLTLQMGDVSKITAHTLPVGRVDLLMGGSPCQGFSFSGKQLNFDDPRSKLFFEFVRLREELNPRWFFLENVKMQKRFSDTITRYLGVEPYVINSNSVSAQSRVRLYWTNIPLVHDLSGMCPVKMEHLLEKNFDGRDVMTKNIVIYANKSVSGLLQVGGVSSNPSARTFMQGYRIYDISGKVPTLAVSTGGISRGSCLITDDIAKGRYSYLTPVECERAQTIPDNYTACLPDAQRRKAIGNAWTVDVVAKIFEGMK
jgi:DNA-cytosine methyltransferase